MKKIIMLLAVTFSLAIVNAQGNAPTKAKSESTKTCTKTKAECDKAKAESKTCTKSAEAKKSCSGSSAKKSCSKTCTGGSTAAYSKTVNAKEFMAYAERFPAEQMIDIRTANEIKASGMVEGATMIDYNSRDFKLKMNELDKDAAIMIYCNSGRRSAEAIPLLKSWGFKKIYEMEGGYKAYLTAFASK